MKLFLVWMAGLLCCVRLEAQTPSAALQEASGLVQAKKWPEAISAYEAITSAEPGNGQAWYQLAQARHANGEYSKAVEAFQKVPALGTSPFVMYNLACAYARLGDKDHAFEWLGKSVGAGFSQLESLESDEDLAGLRADARFAQLLHAAELAITPCKVLPERKQFDFWVGEWDVLTPQGQTAGSSSVQKLVDGCAILENWTGARGGSGKSLNFYDPAKGKWRQVWVGSDGTAIDFEGELKDGAMHYQSESVGSDGKKTLGRMTFFHQGEDRVRQLWEQSTDAGKTWTVAFDGQYIRKGSKPS